MLNNEEKLWKELGKYNVYKIDQNIVKQKEKFDLYAENINGKFVEKEGFTEIGTITRGVTKMSPFFIAQYHLNFTYGLNRAIIFYPKILEIKSSEEFIQYENSLFYDTILLFLINALENYLIDTFKYLAEGIIVSKTDKKDLNNFLKEFNMRNVFFQKLQEFQSLEFSLSELIPDRIDMQQREKAKKAYKLVYLDLAQLNAEIWENIFTKESRGYMQKRHKIIHASFQSDIKNINYINIKNEIDYIEKAILDIAKFVCDIEWYRLCSRPDPMEVKWVENVLQLDYTPKDFNEFKEGIINGFKEYEKQKDL